MAWQLYGISPLALPALGITLVVSALAADRLSRLLRTSRGVAWIVAAGIGGVLSLTLTPHFDATAGARIVGCDLRIAGLLRLDELTDINDRSLNVAMLVPLGLGVGLLPWSRRKVAMTLVALLVPAAVEWIQLPARC